LAQVALVETQQVYRLLVLFNFGKWAAAAQADILVLAETLAVLEQQVHRLLIPESVGVVVQVLLLLLLLLSVQVLVAAAELVFAVLPRVALVPRQELLRQVVPKVVVAVLAVLVVFAQPQGPVLEELMVAVVLPE